MTKTHLLAGEVKHVDCLVVTHRNHTVATAGICVIGGGHRGEASAVDPRAVGQRGDNGVVSGFEQLCMCRIEWSISKMMRKENVKSGKCTKLKMLKVDDMISRSHQHNMTLHGR